MSKSPSSSPKHYQAYTWRKHRGLVKNSNQQLTNISKDVEDLVVQSPIQLLSAPKSKRFKASFRNFLVGNIDPKQLIEYNNFQSTKEKDTIKYDYIKSPRGSVSSFKDAVLMHEQRLKLHETNRFFDLSTQVKLDKKKITKRDNAILRWKKIKDVIQSNIHLRRKIWEEKNKQAKFLDNLEIAFQKSSDFHQQNLRSHQLRTMTVLKEKKLLHTSNPLISPRYYRNLLDCQFKENSDQFLLIHIQILSTALRNLMKHDDHAYNKILHAYLNKKEYYNNWLQEQANRKIINWKKNQSLGRKPMQRLENPFQQTQKVREAENKLIEQVNDIDKIEYDSKSQLKQLLSKNKKPKKKSIIKHNRLFSYPNTSEQIDDYQDNISNASITEALLDQLYQGANSLQQKLQNNKGLNFQRKVRDLLKLEDIKFQTIKANHLKLVPKQHDQLK